MSNLLEETDAVTHDGVDAERSPSTTRSERLLKSLVTDHLVDEYKSSRSASRDRHRQKDRFQEPHLAFGIFRNIDLVRKVLIVIQQVAHSPSYLRMSHPLPRSLLHFDSDVIEVAECEMPSGTLLQAQLGMMTTPLTILRFDFQLHQPRSLALGYDLCPLRTAVMSFVIHFLSAAVVSLSVRELTAPL